MSELNSEYGWQLPADFFSDADHPLNEIGVNPPENLGRFMVRLSEASIPTRYPENLSNVQKEFTETIVKDILARSKGIILWIKAQL